MDGGLPGFPGFPGSNHPLEEIHLQNASKLSGGRILFIDYKLYVPTFDKTLLRNHEKTKKLIEKLKADASNDWNEWKGI